MGLSIHFILCIGGSAQWFLLITICWCVNDKNRSSQNLCWERQKKDDGPWSRLDRRLIKYCNLEWPEERVGSGPNGNWWFNHRLFRRASVAADDVLRHKNDNWPNPVACYHFHSGHERSIRLPNPFIPAVDCSPRPITALNSQNSLLIAPGDAYVRFGGTFVFASAFLIWSPLAYKFMRDQN